MALDRAAQLACERGAVPPTLRLYRWSRPTVTLGRFQPVTAVRSDAARAAGVDVARRFTGGRGVLHDDEVTYAVIASARDGIPRGVAASYRYLCAPLARAYRTLGVRAELTEHDRVSRRSEACYLATTRADLSLGARKLSGSAQVWSGSTVLQHGSFTRSRDVDRESDVFGLEKAERLALEQDAVTLSQVDDVVPTHEEIIEAVVEAFGDVLGVELVAGGWTAAEAHLAEGLLASARVTL